MFESFGLPHLCDEKDKHFEGIKAANKKQYEDFKAETLAKVGQKCITCGGHGILLGVVHMSGPGHACFNCGGSGTFTEQRAKQLITEKRFQIWPALRYKR